MTAYAEVRTSRHRRAVGKRRRYEACLAPVQAVLAPLARRFGDDD